MRCGVPRFLHVTVRTETNGGAAGRNAVDEVKQLVHELLVERRVRSDLGELKVRKRPERVPGDLGQLRRIDVRRSAIEVLEMLDGRWALSMGMVYRQEVVLHEFRDVQELRYSKCWQLE